MASGNSSISGSYFHAPLGTRRPPGPAHASAHASAQVSTLQAQVDEVKAPITEPEKGRFNRSNSKLMLALKGKAKRDGLTKKAQEAKLLKHGKKHSQEHMAFMRYEMEAGKSFKEAHKSAMERYGT